MIPRDTLAEAREAVEQARARLRTAEERLLAAAGWEPTVVASSRYWSREIDGHYATLGRSRAVRLVLDGDV